MANTYKDVKGVGRVSEGAGGVTVSTKSGSYNEKTGQYSIKDLKTGKTVTGNGSKDDYDKAYSSYGSSSGGGGGGSSRLDSSSNNYQNYLEKLKKAQLSASMASLDKQRNSSLSNLSAERATIEPEYQKSKIQAGVTAKQTARSFDEYMAQRGGSKSGIAGQGTLLNNMAYQRQYGELDQAEKSELADNARRVTDVNNNYESDLVGAKAGIEAQALQNYIQQMNLDRAYNQQNYQFDTSTGLQRDQFNANLGLQQAGLTGMYNGQQTLQAKTAQQDQEYRVATLKLQQDSQTWQQQFQEKGFNADESFRLAQLKFQQQQAALDEKYRYATLARSGSSGSGGSSSASLSAIKYQNEMSSQQALAKAMQGLQSMANGGKTRSQLLAHINSNAGDLQANGVPIQDLYGWATKNFTWDKKNGQWYNTADEDD